jgi:translation initiation factor IF-2
MVEAIKAALGSLPQDSIMLRYLLSGAGDISNSDIDLAAASGGMILGFNLSVRLSGCACCAWLLRLAAPACSTRA